MAMALVGANIALVGAAHYICVDKACINLQLWHRIDKVVWIRRMKGDIIAKIINSVGDIGSHTIKGFRILAS